MEDSFAFDPASRRILDYRPGTEIVYGDAGTDTINSVVEPADPEPMSEDEINAEAPEFSPFIGPLVQEIYSAWTEAQAEMAVAANACSPVYASLMAADTAGLFNDDADDADDDFLA